jgi:hypothetical protein
MVPTCCVDPCSGCCHVSCCPQYTTYPVKCVVYECVPVPQEFEVTVCSYKTETYVQPVKYTVYECVPVPQEYTVTVCTYKTETYVQPVKYTVYECVPVPQEYTVTVCSYKPEERTYQCHQTVCEWKQETVVHKECYCVSVPYQATVRVPVCTPVCGGCCP